MYWHRVIFSLLSEIQNQRNHSHKRKPTHFFANPQPLEFTE